MLDFRIHTFLTLCETMSYTKAAEILCITQPAVTQHIHFLEEKYGQKLFLYKGKSLQLTQKGKLLREYSESMLNNSKKIEDEITKKTHSSEILKIGTTKTIGEFLVGEKIIAYLKQNPQYNIILCVENTQILINKLEHGEIDFAIIEGFFDKSKFSYKLLRNEGLIGVCSKESLLADKKIELEEIFNHRIIVRENGSGTKAVFEQMLQNYNYSIESFTDISEVSSFSVIKEMVKSNVGISFVYKSVVETELNNGELKQLKINGVDFSHEFNYVFLKNNLFMDKYENFLNI